MAVVQGIREKVHMPLYDALSVEPAQQLREVESSSILKFFVNVQGKTKLQTNLQSASLLPHYNTFEARAMRVVISDLPPEFPDKDKAKAKETEFDVTDPDGKAIDKNGNVEGEGAYIPGDAVTADLELGLDRWMELLKEARDSEDKEAEIILPDQDEGVTLSPEPPDLDKFLKREVSIVVSAKEIEDIVEKLKNKAPPKEQLKPNDGAGNIVSKLIYNTVTTFYVGEKAMVQAPTWMFPAGAGPYSETGKFTTHGEPNPLATFRFAEPIYIDKQQNFRVELEVPDSSTLKELQQLYGPLNIWVVLDGYMTRDVQ
jgi:hypothetical protein